METTHELNFLTALLPLVGVMCIIAVGVVFLNLNFHKNLYRQKLEQQELRNRHHQELLKSSIAVQETERKRIAQDLHDELGASLSIARMHLVQLEKQSQDHPTQEMLRQLKVITDSTLASIRRISHELMPPLLETFGLVRTLESVVDQANISGGITITLDADDIPRLSWPIELGVYRICMELIHNTLKHAHATTIDIIVRLSPVALLVQYQDNGVGIHGLQESTGLGFKNLEARASSLGGVITFKNTNESSPGFYLHVQIPVQRDQLR